MIKIVIILKNKSKISIASCSLFEVKRDVSFGRLAVLIEPTTTLIILEIENAIV